MTKAVEGRGVQSVEVGARILRALVELGAPAMLRDVATKAAVASAQAHAYLVSFRNAGLVEQDPSTGRYLLGPFALQLGLARMRQVDALRLAAAAAGELAADLGLMVTLSVWGTHGPTIVQVVESETPIHVNLRAGAVYTLTGTATGRLFAAYMPQAVLAPLLQAELRAQSASRAIGLPTSRKALASATDDVRSRGFATTAGSPVPGINAIAVPVFDHAGQLQAALTLIGPEPAVGIDPDGPLAIRVRRFAESVSAKLGWDPSRMPAEEPAAKPRARRSAGRGPA